MKKNIGCIVVLVSIIFSMACPQANAASPASSLKEKIYMMGGSNTSSLNDVWSSADLKQWVNLVPNGSISSIWSPRNFPRTLYLNGKIYLLGGNAGNDDPSGPVSYQFWSSVDGVAWQQLQNLPWTVDIYEHTNEKSYVTYNGKIWALGGYNHDPVRDGKNYLNDIWSFDGTNWKKEDNAPWRGRSSFGSVVYKSRLWVIGGFIDSSETTNEVWSFDGKYWKKEKSLPYSLAFGNGQQPLAPFKDKLWIFGNMQYSGNNVLSFDGKKWKTEAYAPWQTRANHVNLIANDTVYVFGGLHSENKKPPTYLNDVWSFDGKKWHELPSAPWQKRGYFDAVVTPSEFGIECVSTMLPTVGALPATNISNSGAILNGGWTSGGCQSKTWFEYGTTKSLGNTTTPASQSSFISGGIYNLQVPNLSPLTTYYYQICASNSLGKSCGDILPLTTTNTSNSNFPDGCNSFQGFNVLNGTSCSGSGL